MKTIFNTNGLLSNSIDSYEYREEQLIMADFIASRLDETGNAIIEAGTGIGKTIAYLIPTIIHAVDNNKKIAISTETKALQKQLIDKDIPIAQKVLQQRGVEFSFSLCLGSANYPCRRRFQIAQNQGLFSKKDIPVIEDLHERFREGLPFSRFDIRISNDLWNAISREPDSCGSYNCPFFNTCLFQKTRREWAHSHLLVMNHYLFFSNIASSRTFLPPFDIVIFDEAHSLESIGCSQLGFCESYNGFSEHLSRFRRQSKKRDILSAIKDPSIKAASVSLLKEIETESSRFFESLRSLLGEKKHHRFSKPHSSGERFVAVLRNFITPLISICDDIENESERIEFEIALGKLFTSYKNIESGVHLLCENFVYWIESDGNFLLGNTVLFGKPVDISERMEQDINSYYDSVFYISATLSINESFEYITGQLGICNTSTLLLKSPFDYSSQVTLLLEKESVFPDNKQYSSIIARSAADIITRLSGNCLILFTSYAMLNRVRNELENLVQYPLFSQGDAHVSEVLDEYRTTEGSVLLGTHSFWQGIDLPGELLRGVIITRLPFSVPDHPHYQAKVEQVSGNGKNPFYSLQIPEAIIRFKQGFGRLIRSKTDYGVVAVLDPRITQKNYGSLFINSIPVCRKVYHVSDM